MVILPDNREHSSRVDNYFSVRAPVSLTTADHTEMWEELLFSASRQGRTILN